MSLKGEIRGNYGPVHDWGADSTGEALAGRPDLQNRAKDRRLVYEALLARAEAGEFARPSELYQSEVGTLSEPDVVQPREKVTAPIPMDRLR